MLNQDDRRLDLRFAFVYGVERKGRVERFEAGETIFERRSGEIRYIKDLSIRRQAIDQTRSESI